MSSEQQQIKSDIERTRAELAETTAAIAAKLDVKRQAKRHEKVTLAAVAAAAALAGLLVVRRLTKSRD